MTDADRLVLDAVRVVFASPPAPGEWAVRACPDGSTLMADWRDGHLRLVVGRVVSGMAVADGEATV